MYKLMNKKQYAPEVGISQFICQRSYLCNMFGMFCYI